MFRIRIDSIESKEQKESEVRVEIEAGTRRQTKKGRKFMHNFDSDWMETTWMRDNWRRRPQPWRWRENHMLKTSSSVNSRWRHLIAAVVAAVTTTDLCPTVSSDSEAARAEVDFDASTWCGDFDTYEIDRESSRFHTEKQKKSSQHLTMSWLVFPTSSTDSPPHPDPRLTSTSDIGISAREKRAVSGWTPFVDVGYASLASSMSPAVIWTLAIAADLIAGGCECSCRWDWMCPRCRCRSLGRRRRGSLWWMEIMV